MAQRDYEEQPEAPDLGASGQLESGATLGSAGDRDAFDAGYVPPDRPYGLDEDGVTAAGMREGDTLDRRLAREQPEEGPTDQDRSGRIVIADSGAAMETPDGVQGVDVGVDGGASSAEEAAVHEGSDGGGAPVETEPSVADSPALADPELDASLADDPAARRASADAARDAAAEGEPVIPARDGAGPDPALRRDVVDRDPAAGIDAVRDAAGAAAPASGRDDVGPGSGL